LEEETMLSLQGCWRNHVACPKRLSD